MASFSPALPGLSHGHAVAVAFLTSVRTISSNHQITGLSGLPITSNLYASQFQRRSDYPTPDCKRSDLLLPNENGRYDDVVDLDKVVDRR